MILGDRVGVWARQRRLASGAITCTGKGWRRSYRTGSFEDVWSLQRVPPAQLSGVRIEVQPIDGLVVAVDATGWWRTTRPLLSYPSLILDLLQLA